MCSLWAVCMEKLQNLSDDRMCKTWVLLITRCKFAVVSQKPVFGTQWSPTLLIKIYLPVESSSYHSRPPLPWLIIFFRRPCLPGSDALVWQSMWFRSHKQFYSADIASFCIWEGKGGLSDGRQADKLMGGSFCVAVCGFMGMSVVFVQA